MRIGPARQPFDQRRCLDEWCNDTGNGIIGYYSYDELPEEMIDFIWEQHERFKVPTLDRKTMDKVMRAGAWASFYLLDQFDPYLLLVRGVSDIAWSDIGHTHTIEVTDPYNKTKEEANPEHVEAFVPAPQQAENFFNYAMAHPGLDALPNELGEMIRMHLFEWGGPEDWLDTDVVQALQGLCINPDGTLDGTKYKAYWELSAWAGFLWMVGPPGKEWRMSSHDAFWLCETEGLAILYDTCFLSKDYYTISPRVPQSCVVCGLDSYCVELAHVDGMTRFVCERHLNGELPLYQGATCGTKVCKFAVCPHHPLHGQEDAIYRMLSSGGQIHQLNERKGGRPAEIAVGLSRKLIANK